MSRPMDTAPIGVSVIGGFLGAGKTTLLNHLLANNPTRRLAVLVNDFGDINIDWHLVERRDALTIALTNGCVCCQIGDDLSRALIGLIEQVPAPEAIVIEASGVADPWRIAQVALADRALSLEGVLVVFDAHAGLSQLADPQLADTLIKQLQGADLVVLNKCDLLAPDALAQVHRRLDQLIGPVPRFETRFARLPEILLDGARINQLAEALPKQRSALAGHPAHADFEAMSARFARPFRAVALRALLKDMPAGVMRMKGVIATDQYPQAILQFAGRHGSLRAAPWIPSGDLGALVAIGLRGQLDRLSLTSRLHDALAVTDLKRARQTCADRAWRTKG